MSERECLKGWIMAPSPTDGKDVPFFVKVRGKDIVWDTSDNSKELEKIANKGSNVEFVNPQGQWKFNVDKWVVTLNQDATYTANIKVNIPREFTQEDETSLRGVIDLPLETLNDVNFNIQCTKMTDVNELIKSDVTVLPEFEAITSSIEISIDSREEGGFFNIDFDRIYNSFICITVTGKVNL